MGSNAYGVASDNSDLDLYGFCIPSKDVIFPHLRGEIPGFGRQLKRFEQWQEYHIIDKSANGGKSQEYDFAVYSIVKYFQLCMENNPNMIDSLFTPIDCVLHITQIGQLVKDNRDLFLHKGSWHKFRGYAYSQLHKMNSKNPRGNRKELVEKYGYDIKFAYHVVRLVLEVQQILEYGTLDLRRDRELLKSIRRGEWTQEQVRTWFTDKEKQLESVYEKSDLPYKPDEVKIKDLLLTCLELHYGNLSDCVAIENTATRAIREIQDVLNKYRL